MRTCVSAAAIALVYALRVAALGAQGDAAAEVLAFERQLEEAVVRGDVAFFDQATPPDFSFGWFERVYAKRNGRWQFLSHRTVHGPNPAPAGIDATSAPGK